MLNEGGDGWDAESLEILIDGVPLLHATDLKPRTRSGGGIEKFNAAEWPARTFTEIPLTVSADLRRHINRVNALVVPPADASSRVGDSPGGGS